MTKLKVLLIGPEKSGKSVIANYLYNDLREAPQVYRPTVGFRVLQAERKVRNPTTGIDETVYVDFWDVSGSLKYESTWQVAQTDADGVIIITNADKPGQNQEVEAWIKNFPKKMKISHTQCMGLANHPSGTINDYTQLSIMSVGFSHCSFESRNSTVGPTIDKFLAKVAERKATAAHTA